MHRCGMMVCGAETPPTPIKDPCSCSQCVAPRWDDGKNILLLPLHSTLKMPSTAAMNILRQCIAASTRCSSRSIIQQRSASRFTSSPAASRIFPQRRQFHLSRPLQHNELTPPPPGQERKVTFIDKEGHDWTFEVADGDNLLDIAQSNDLEMEGACGGSCACSTCHVIVRDEDAYDKMVS